MTDAFINKLTETRDKILEQYDSSWLEWPTLFHGDYPLLDSIGYNPFFKKEVGRERPIGDGDRRRTDVRLHRALDRRLVTLAEAKRANVTGAALLAHLPQLVGYEQDLPVKPYDVVLSNAIEHPSHLVDPKTGKVFKQQYHNFNLRRLNKDDVEWAWMHHANHVTQENLLAWGLPRMTSYETFDRIEIEEISADAETAELQATAVESDPVTMEFLGNRLGGRYSSKKAGMRDWLVMYERMFTGEVSVTHFNSEENWARRANPVRRDIGHTEQDVYHPEKKAIRLKNGMYVAGHVSVGRMYNIIGEILRRKNLKMYVDVRVLENGVPQYRRDKGSGVTPKQQIALHAEFCAKYRND